MKYHLEMGADLKLISMSLLAFEGQVFDPFNEGVQKYITDTKEAAALEARHMELTMIKADNLDMAINGTECISKRPRPPVEVTTPVPMGGHMVDKYGQVGQPIGYIDWNPDMEVPTGKVFVKLRSGASGIVDSQQVGWDHTGSKGDIMGYVVIADENA